ncbi:MAG: hypothetical protein J6J24_05630 [Clostridia bacterium]|nr:hypothetical protein [Clostridia bacterium]
MNKKQLAKFNKMSYSEKKAQTKKLLKQARIFSIATLAGVGLVIGCATTWLATSASKSKNLREFERENGIDYLGYVEQVKAEELEKLQESVLAEEISFEEYEDAKSNIETPSEMEYLQTLEPEVLKEYNKLNQDLNKLLLMVLSGRLLLAPLPPLRAQPCLTEK